MSVDFIDSSVLLYQFDETDPRKMEIADALVFSGLRDAAAVISFQVVQETLNVLTGKLVTAVTPGDRDQYFTDVLRPLWKVWPSEALYRRALELKHRYAYSFYDSLIIAAALSAGCQKIQSEDLHHGQRIEGLTITNPFQ